MACVACSVLIGTGCVLGLEEHSEHNEAYGAPWPDPHSLCCPYSASSLCSVRMHYRLLWVDGVAWCERKASSNRHTFVCARVFPKLMEGFLRIGRETKSIRSTGIGISWSITIMFFNT